MEAVNWPEVFGEICDRDEGALDWALPEAWIHAELYASQRRRWERSRGWEPFDNEIPYSTSTTSR